MGLDEALLERPETPPTLRFYTWSPDTLSLGYFQRWRDVPNASSAGAVVRRITGGGAIHHTGELTFSIVLARDHPLYRGPVRDSYARVHDAIAATLGTLGVSAERRGAAEVLSDVAETGMCFHESTPLDLVWLDRKGVGSAQRRRSNRVLHHGSIKLSPTPLETGVATLAEAGVTIAPEELAGALVETFEEAFGIRLEPGEPTGVELDEASARGGRYRETEFVRRR